MTEGGDELEFERAVPASDAGGAAAPGVTCANCGTKDLQQYFALGNAPLCERCRNGVVAEEQRARSGGTFARALGAGFLAALVGAALYYAVLALLELEIGIVAIAIGFMVGWAIQRVIRGWGSRRYQVLAVLLTYLSVGLAYLPIAISGAKSDRDGPPAAAATTDSLTKAPDSLATTTAPAPAPAAGDSMATVSTAATTSTGIAMLYVFAFALALPVLVIIGSMPGGILSALIIGFGMQQAWRMTGRHVPALTGPYTVGGKAPPGTR